MGQRIPVTLGNIAPLSLRPFQPGSVALVCEGGDKEASSPPAYWMSSCARSSIPLISTMGRRLARKTFQPISVTSPVTAAKLLCVTPPDANFLTLVRLLRGGNLIDLDWLVDSTATHMPLAMDNAERLFAARESDFILCACRGR